MPRTALHSAGRGTKAHWNERTVFERLKLILEYAELFLALRLITLSELEMARRMKPVEWEYIVEREMRPIFTSVDLKEMIENQPHGDKLLAALRAVFD